MFSKWAVVQFPKDEISTIPRAWITTIFDKTTCKWPNSNVRKHIQKATEPEHSWKTYEISILMETDNYDDAIKYEKKKSLTSDSSDENSEPAKARKRKLKINHDYLSDVSESEIDPPPLLKKCEYDKPSSPHFDNESPVTLDTLTLSDQEENSEIDVILMPPPPIPTKNWNDEDSARNKGNTGEKGDYTENNDICCAHGLMLNAIFENVVAIRTVLKEQNRNFEHIENMVLRRDENITTLDTVPKKPFKLYRKLMSYNEEIKKLSSGKETIGSSIFLCGGPNGKCVIRRGLAKLFTDSLAKKCSWTGKGNNFPLRHLLVMGILKDAARKRFSDVTDAYCESVVSNWFRQAQLRYDRAISKETE